MGTKTSAEADGAPAVLTDIYRIARAGTNKRLSHSDLLALVGTYISDTAANTLTAAGNNEFIPGSWRRITDANSNTTDLYICVKPNSTSELEEIGFGTYQNSVMTGGVDFPVIKYNLTTDYVSVLAHDINNNILIQTTGADLIGKMEIDLVDSGTVWFKNNILVDVAGTWQARHTACVGVHAYDVTINTDKLAGTDDVLLGYFGGLKIGTSTVMDVFSDYTGAPLHAAGGLTFGVLVSGTIGEACTIGATACNFKSITIGNGKTISTDNLPPAYNGEGGYYVSNKSTFAIDGSVDSAVNPDGAGVCDMSNCPFVGVVGITNAANPLETITGSGIAGFHTVIFYSAGAGDITVNDNSTSGGGVGNIFLETGTVILEEAKGHYIELGGHVKGGGKYQQYSISQPITAA